MLTIEDVRRLAGSDESSRLAELQSAGAWDGLPVCTELAGRFAAGLRRHGAPGETVAAVPPLMRPATIETLAALAALAGCEPEQLPVLAAAVRALAAPAFNGLGVATTTGSAACMLIVSGPAATRLGFNGAVNCLGPGFRANATIGRALGFVLRHVGGAAPGSGDMATMGQPGKYTFCLAENAADSPWEPLHVHRGLAAEQSAVTLFAAAGTMEVVDPYAATADEVLDVLGAALACPRCVTLDAARPLVGTGRACVLVTPEWAAILAGDGLSRSDVAVQLCRRAAIPAAGVPASLQRELGGTDPVHAFASADDVELVVAGGVGIKQTLVPGWNYASAPVTEAI